jgi:hypothetical protein
MGKFWSLGILVVAFVCVHSFADSVEPCTAKLDQFSARTLVRLNKLDGRQWKIALQKIPPVIGPSYLRTSPGLFGFSRWLIKPRVFSWKRSGRGEPDPVSTLIAGMGPLAALFFGLEVQNPPDAVWIPSGLELNAAIQRFNAGIDVHNQIPVTFFFQAQQRSYRADTVSIVNFQNNYVPWPDDEDHDLQRIGEAISSTLPLILEPVEVIQRWQEQARLITLFIRAVQPHGTEPRQTERGLIAGGLSDLLLHAGDLTTGLRALNDDSRIDVLKPWQPIDHIFLEKLVTTFTKLSPDEAVEFVAKYGASFPFETVSPMSLDRANELRDRRRTYIKARTAEILALPEYQTRLIEHLNSLE